MLNHILDGARRPDTILNNGADSGNLMPRNDSSSIKPPKSKKPLGKNEEFVDYRYDKMPDGTLKRKKIIKKTQKKVKMLTDEQMEEIDNAFYLFDKD